jgi:serine/threonine protein kinase
MAAIVMTFSLCNHSAVMPESIIRRVVWQSLLALHHLHTTHEGRPGLVHRALSPEKGESYER